MCMCECLCFTWASLPYAFHSSLSVLPCLTGSFFCVWEKPGAHSRISAPHRNPFQSLLVSSDTPTIHIPCKQPYSVSSTLESHETELHPGLASHPASPSPPSRQSLTVSVCISAQQILTKEATDLHLSLIPYHIHVWPNMAQEWAAHIHVRAWKDSVYLKKWTVSRCSLAWLIMSQQ